MIERRPARLTYAIACFAIGSLVLSACDDGGATAATASHEATSQSSTNTTSTTSTTNVPSAPSTTNAPSTTSAPRRLPGHTSWIETFVDRSRPTTPAAGTPVPSRTLVTTLYRPNGAGPFPLIVFSHGLDGHPAKFTKLFAAWADAGFAIAAPAFPLTNSGAPDPNSNVGDVGRQPADVSFVLDNVLTLDKQPRSRLFHAIDASRIGAGGLSLGGLTTYMLVYGACCRDQRIDAVEVLDGLRSDERLDGHVPLLIAHSDTDPTLPYSSARQAFTAAHAPVWLVTLHGASHASEWEDTVTPYDHIAERITVDFWEATLNGNSQAFARLQRDATVPGLSSIIAKATTPQ